jgi:hypothetical protein
MVVVRMSRYPLRPYHALRNSLLGCRHARGTSSSSRIARSPALTAVPFGEGDEGPSDTGAALVGSCDQQPELARLVRDVMDADGAGDLAVAGGDRELSGPDQLGELGRRRPRRPVAPEPALGRRVDVVDEAGELIDEPGIVADRRIEQADGDRLIGAHRVEDARRNRTWQYIVLSEAIVS